MRGYYYCSLETFLNIIKNGCIYLSDPLKMNDSEEIKWCIRNIMSDIQDEDFALIERIKNRASMNFSCDELLSLLDRVGQDSVFVACFSEEGDMLSQWRAYGDDGCGVSIGFDLEKLASADNLLIEKINYKSKIEEDNNETDFECVADTMSTVFAEKGIEKEEDKMEIFLHELIPLLAKYKNPAFREEKEIRLIYCDDMMFEKIVDSYGGFREPFKNEKLQHDFRTIGKNNITEFVKLQFEFEAIESIVIGPRCKLRDNDIVSIFKQICGIVPEVKHSNASYQ